MQVDLRRLTDPSFLASGDLHALWKQLRATGSAVWTPDADGPGFWSVTRYADGVRVLRDCVGFSSARGTTLEGNRWADDPAGGKMLALMDPPHHGEMRQKLSHYFQPRLIDGLEPAVTEVVTQLLRRCSDLVEFDFVAQVASRLPVSIFFKFANVPAEDWDRLSELVFRTVLPDEFERQIADGELLAYLSDLAASQRVRGDDGLFGRIATMEIAGRRLSEEEVTLSLANFVSAGIYTTRLATSGGLHALIQHPQQFERLKRNPALVDTAVDEMLRWTCPGLVFYRTATRAVELGDCHIAEADRVAVWLPSLNRDADVFVDADSFDVARSPNRHIGFGYGPHACIGAMLARLEMRILFREIVAQWKDVAATGEPTKLRSLVLQGIDYLPLRVAAA